MFARSIAASRLRSAQIYAGSRAHISRSAVVVGSSNIGTCQQPGEQHPRRQWGCANRPTQHRGRDPGAAMTTTSTTLRHHPVAHDPPLTDRERWHLPA